MVNDNSEVVDLLVWENFSRAIRANSMTVGWDSELYRKNDKKLLQLICVLLDKNILETYEEDSYISCMYDYKALNKKQIHFNLLFNHNANIVLNIILFSNLSHKHDDDSPQCMHCKHNTALKQHLHIKSASYTILPIIKIFIKAICISLAITVLKNIIGFKNTKNPILKY